MSNAPKPVLLLILDGWGYRENPKYNAIAMAKTPNFTALWNTYPHTLIQASEKYVGLPAGQMGNSEVGHLNMGAGRVIYQDLCRISNDIENGQFFKNKVLNDAIDKTVKTKKAIHIYGLLSPGGIHSSDEHIYAAIELAAKKGTDQIYFHAFLDGRDTPPKSAEAYIQNLEKVLTKIGKGKIASLTGRYFAMDRDKRWDRVERAYNLLTLGEATYHAETAVEGLKMAYAHGETDEFVPPTSIHSAHEKPITINDGDSILFMNFRSDRAREITRAFIDPNFKEFQRKKVVQLTEYVALTQYDESFKIPVAYPPENLKNTLCAYLASQHKTQLHIAETEKYAHVTFFFNGGVEASYEGEDRILIPSPKVATYDLKPEMSVMEITEKLVEAIQGKKYDFIVCNFANPDMVGHTGNLQATIQAIDCVDVCLGKIITAIKNVSGEMIVTADHGNAELQFDEVTQQPHTSHTTNPVPFIYMGRPAKIQKGQWALCDVAPTLLTLMGLPIPKEMTGKPIVGK